MISPRQLLRTALIACAATVLCVVAASATDLGVGTVKTDGLRLRAEASTDSTILVVVGTGDIVIVKDNIGDGWYEVSRNGVSGYMFANYVDVSTKQEAKLGYGEVSTDGATLNVRSGAGTSFDRVKILENGAVVELVGMENGWYKVDVNGTTGYVLSDYIVPCEKPAPAPAPASRSSSKSSGSSSYANIVYSAEGTELGKQIVAYAKQFLGVPYVWGGNGPKCFDCSGFTKYVYAHFGYYINRTASAQLKNGRSVSRDSLQAGDLVFFYNGKVSTPVSHVGIYIGSGYFIHASSNSYTVEISSLYAKNYAQKYVYARRII